MSAPNEHGVYVDDIEKIEFATKRVVAEIRVACCLDGLWRWGYRLDLKGDPWIYSGFMGPISDRDEGCADRQTAIQEAADFLLKIMANAERGYKVSDTPARRDLERWLESIGCLGGQLVLF